MPTMTPVDSSLIKAAGYDVEKEELTIEFHSGAVYIYKEVSLPVYEAMLGARSPGKFFLRNVKGQYDVTRL